MYSHSGATLSKMLECLVNFIAKCKLIEWICIRILSQQKKCMWQYFFYLTNVRSKWLLLGHLPNLVGHCPMSDSNLQPWYHAHCTIPCYSMPYRNWYPTIPHQHTTPYCTIPYHIIPYHTHHTIPYCTIPYHIIPYQTIPFSPYCTIQ
jgi:hypothetical protein